jgi:hypothetical protein
VLIAFEVAVADVTVADGVGLAFERADELDAVGVAVAGSVGRVPELVPAAFKLGLKKVAALELAAAANLEAVAADRGTAARGAPAGTWPGTGVSGRPSRRI